MPRLPKPTLHQGHYCTRASTGKWHQLCPAHLGEAKARELLDEYLTRLREEQRQAEEQ